MSDKIQYYIDILLAACGFDGSSGLPWLDVVVVSIAAFIVVYAVYRMIVCSLWPGETDHHHVKYSILDGKDGHYED